LNEIIMVETRQLFYFAAVAEELHFGRAAERVGVAQSAMSTQVQRLERQLGMRLLNRNKRQPISLTSAGALVYAEAQAALRHVQRAEEVAALSGMGLAGLVRVGYVASAVTSGLLSRALREFRQTNPDVAVSVVAMETPRQLEAIANGEVDIGIVRPRRQYPENVKATVVHAERMLVALPEDHPLARKAILKASDLRGERFVSPQFDETEGFAETLANLGKAGGFSVGREYRVNDVITAVSLAAAGYGVALVAESMQRFAQPGVVYKPIRDFPQLIYLALAERRREPSKAVQAFAGSSRGLRQN
jgi:DNA-binding transcriptional LysR family regulator